MNTIIDRVELDERGHLVTKLEEQPRHSVSYSYDRGEHELNNVRQYIRGGYMHDDDQPPPAA